MILGVQQISTDRLVANGWNPNEMDDDQYRKARESIRKFGFIDPITVRADRDGLYQIIDGEHRWKAAKDEGLEEVWIVIIDADDADAEQLTFILNELRGRPNPQKLAALVRDLASKRSMSELEAVLPLRRQQLAAMVSGRRDQIDWDALQQKPESTEKKERWVERVFRLPQSAADVVDEALQKVREDGVADDWKALELICADYVAGV
jgi:ParB/RepB/Spo0J family partition protein